MAIAFVLRHPSNPVPIIGSQSPERIRSSVDALKVKLSRAEWYSIVVAARGEPLP
jgi:predicted oxidoreductase